MKFKHIYIVTAALIVMVTAACKKDLLKANTNPDTATPVVYNPNFTLTEVQLFYTGTSDVAADNWQTEWGGIAGYVQHIASTNTAYYYGDKYLLSTGNVSAYFSIAYSTQVQPVVDLIHLTAGKPQYNNMHQIARIMRALVFQRLTDMYGDVPYSQAGLGYYERIYTPVYDHQQDIYNDMLKEVSQAVDSLSTTGDGPTGDLYYYNAGGPNTAAQITEWKKFGNSLLLRLGMRLTKIDPAAAKNWVAKAIDPSGAGVMTSNDDNAIVHHTDVLPLDYNKDAYAIIYEDQTDVQLSSTFINTLQQNHDSRIRVYSWLYANQDTVASHQLGLPPGVIQGGKDSTTDITKQQGYPAALGLLGYSRINGTILNYSAPNFIITYAQTELLLADAATRFGVGGDATTLYKNGVEAAFTQLSAYSPPVVPTVAQADGMITANPLSADKATALNQINTQYWITSFMDEYEAWANWRRTSNANNTHVSLDTISITNENHVVTTADRQVSGYPQLHATNYKANITGGTIPRRLQYPIDQQFSNAANYKAAVLLLKGGDGQTQRVWWDVTNDNSDPGIKK